MNKKYAKVQSTRRSLIMSILSLILCFAMLIGTTYAWFTDSVTSGNNRIVAGNLDVEMFYKNKKTSTTSNVWQYVNNAASGDVNPIFVDSTGNEILWEPGVVTVTSFKVANVGNLALKYLFTTTTDANKVNGHDLTEVIKAAVIDGDKYSELTTREAAIAAGEGIWENINTFAKNGELLPNDNTDGGNDETCYTVILYWAPTDHDDYYNMNNNNNTEKLYIDIDVCLKATQLDHEDDSFDSKYDEKASVKVSSIAEINTALPGSVVVLEDDIVELGSEINRTSDIMIDMNGHKLECKKIYIKDESVTAEINIQNGTFIGHEGIWLLAPNGDVVGDNIDVQIDPGYGPIHFDATLSSLKFGGNVSFSTTSGSKAYVSIPADTHVVIEEDAVVTAKQIIVTAPTTAPAEGEAAVFDLDNNGKLITDAENDQVPDVTTDIKIDSDAGKVEVKIEENPTAPAEDEGVKVITVDTSANNDAVVEQDSEDYEAIVGGKAYETVAKAKEAITAGNYTLKLLKDVKADGIAIAKNKNFILDLNKFTLDIDGETVGSAGTKTNGFQFLKGANVTIKNGTLTSAKAKILIQNYSNLTLTDVVVDGSKIIGNYVLSNNCGAVAINGSTSITAPKGKYAFDVCWAPTQGYPEGAQVTVDTTGKIDGKVELGLWGTQSGEVKSKLVINNGIFEGAFVVDETVFNSHSVEIFNGLFKIAPATKYLAGGAVLAPEVDENGYWAVSAPIAEMIPNGAIYYKGWNGASTDGRPNSFTSYASKIEGDGKTTAFPEIENGDMMVYEEYAYIYHANDQYCVDGWQVIAIKNQAEYHSIADEINGKYVKSMNGCFRFYWQTSYRQYNLIQKAPEIPAHMEDMQNAFSRCYYLTQGPSVIPESVKNMNCAFLDCPLTGTIEVNAKLDSTKYDDPANSVFHVSTVDYSSYLPYGYSYTKNVTITGTSPQLEAIMETNTQNGVTISK